MSLCVRGYEKGERECYFVEILASKYIISTIVGSTTMRLVLYGNINYIITGFECGGKTLFYIYSSEPVNRISFHILPNYVYYFPEHQTHPFTEPISSLYEHEVTSVTVGAQARLRVHNCNINFIYVHDPNQVTGDIAQSCIVPLDTQSQFQ